MRVAPYKYRRSREIAISNNVNICKVKELNFAALTDNMLLQKDSIDQIETEDIFRKVIANLKTRQRFLAIMTYRQGWNIQDIMQHYKIDYRRARDYRLYMQRRFKKELKAIEKVI